MDRNAANTLLFVGLAAGGLVLLTNRAAPRNVATATDPSTPDPVPASPSVPVDVPMPPPAARVVSTAHSKLVDACEKAIYKEVPARRLSPLASRTLAVNLVSVCQELNYPLDLALGQAFVESDLRLLARNSSSGAVGPLQVTSIAAAQVGMSWPIESPVAQLRAGLKYMVWLRRTYPQCQASVRESLRHYGMGRGNWLKFKAGALSCSTSLSVARAELGCPNTRPYSATAIAVAKRHPELHTAAWWGS